ncbi:hypothetical protein ACFQH9_28410 [Pseudonocardia lutea]|uniref:NodB homology domain-containing protein n=1 Tax=Pseudonocardia lutea TaxID=2172015 RepID=A0ABW1IHF3_9PSEU
MSVPEVAFESVEPFAFFDYFRVPYRIRQQAAPATLDDPVLARLWPVPDSTTSLYWYRALPDGGARRRPIRFDCAGYRLAGRVLDDDRVRFALGHRGNGFDGQWQPRETLRDDAGRAIGSVWRHGKDGSVLLPFDPGEVMATLWSERYRRADRSGIQRLMRGAALSTYYLVRPLMPRRVQLGLRRAFTRLQRRASFPGWPIEDGLHGFYDWMFHLLGDLAGRPVPWLAPWPDGASWAMVLTHDVETAAGLCQRDLLRARERAYGLRSSWNLVAERYVVPDDVVQTLWDEGCEVGVHGLRHDGRDLGSARFLRQRLPAMHAAAARWAAVGFRAPATQRRWEWMPQLGFAYDSSSTDTDPYEPQPGGCCTVWPFLNDDLVELPITLPQDHTLFAILSHTDGRLWCRKVGYLRARGGMALALTHPDYACDPRVVNAYEELLALVHDDPHVWHALPHEVAGWWRRRAATEIRHGPTGWEIVGPAAAEGRIWFGPPAHAMSVSDGVSDRVRGSTSDLALGEPPVS